MYHNTISECNGLSLHIDAKTGIEQIIVTDFFSTNDGNPIIHTSEKPFGSFFNDFKLPQCMNFQDFIDLFLTPDSNYNKESVEATLSELKNSDSLIHTYLYIQLMDLYKKYPEEKKCGIFKNNQDNIEDIKTDIYNKLQELVYPYKSRFCDKILDTQLLSVQDHIRYNPMVFINRDFWIRPTTIFYEVGTNSNLEYAYTTLSLIPILTYYCQKILGMGFYFSQCKCCGKVFITKNPRVNTLCSEKCRAKQKAIAAETYRNKPKNPITRIHNNCRVYWNTAIRTAELPNGRKTDLSKELEEEYAKYQEKAREQKKKWKQEPPAEQEIKQWYYSNANSKICEIQRKYK